MELCRPSRCSRRGPPRGSARSHACSFCVPPTPVLAETSVSSAGPGGDERREDGRKRAWRHCRPLPCCRPKAADCSAVLECAPCALLAPILLQALVVMSAMKMETSVNAQCSGTVQHVYVIKGGAWLIS